TLSVSDNSKLTASTPFSIMVNKKNLPPTIGGTPSKTTFYATRKYTFKPTTNDPEKDKLTFSIEGAPDWLNFNENTGEISAQPTINDISPTRYEVTISVSDNAGNKRSLKPFTLSVQAGIKTATISWTAPTKNADGSELNDLDGYRIYYGPTKARQYENKTEQFGIGIDSYMIENLQLPEYFFSMTAIDTLGNESEYSKSVNKQVD
ncbi:MAG: putative Ig domain-containing protein, partial [Gammaproteobacteria bacterium]|nr:putative Ig domain-containing protein [Gammaproteobacteria bacterium]